MTDYNRVVITGIGVVCSAGKNIIEFWNSISAGTCYISKVQNFDTSKYSSNIAGEIKDFKLNFSPKKVKSKYIGRTTSLLLEATNEAFKNANINLEKINNDRVGAVLGCTLGELKQGQEIYNYWVDRKNKKIRPSYLVTFPIYRPLDIFTLEFGITGPKSLITTACASGTNSIGYASDLIHRGKADMMVTGGIDPLSRLSYAGFDGLMLLSKKPCTPFSRQSGLSLGEGAGILILENLNSALKRNAPILAEVIGYGLSGDAFHSTAPDPSGSGPARAINFAIQDAAISQESIDYINAHGTGTKFNDTTETKAIKLVFGERAKQVPISSTKSIIGHTLGAAGAIESIATILTLKNDLTPPTANFVEPDEGCDLDYVPNKARKKTVNVALSNSFGFGGNNAALVLSKYSDQKSSSKKYIDNRVVITGLGIVNPVGIGIDNFWKNVIDGKSGLKPITSFDTSKYASKKGGEVTDFNPKDFIHFSRLRRMDRISQLAVTSTKLAIEDADLSITNENCERIGLIFGTGTGPMDSIMGSITEVYTEASNQKLTTVSPARFLNTVFNAAAGHVSIEFKIKGLNSTIAMGGVSSSNAICYAYDLIKTGRADAICVVSSDEIGETLFAGYSKLGILAKKNGNISEDSRPFDKDRNGFIISEGSATIILETLEHAQKRNAKIYSELTGYGMTSDKDSFFDNDEQGEQLAKAMQIAMDEAELRPQDIDYILSNANSSYKRDISESNAIKKAFNKLAYSIAISAIKSMTGEADGGGGINSVIAGILAMRDGKIAPTINYKKKDEMCDLDYTPNAKRDVNVKNFLVNSCSYGGSNISILFSRFSN